MIISISAQGNVARVMRHHNPSQVFQLRRIEDVRDIARVNGMSRDKTRVDLRTQVTPRWQRWHDKIGNAGTKAMYRNWY